MADSDDFRFSQLQDFAKLAGPSRLKAFPIPLGYLIGQYDKAVSNYESFRKSDVSNVETIRGMNWHSLTLLALGQILQETASSFPRLSQRDAKLIEEQCRRANTAVEKVVRQLGPDNAAQLRARWTEATNSYFEDIPNQLRSIQLAPSQTQSPQRFDPNAFYPSAVQDALSGEREHHAKQWYESTSTTKIAEEWRARQRQGGGSDRSVGSSNPGVSHPYSSTSPQQGYRRHPG